MSDVMSAALARLEREQCNLAGAVDRLRAAQAQASIATVQAINAQRQLLRCRREALPL